MRYRRLSDGSHPPFLFNNCNNRSYEYTLREDSPLFISSTWYSSSPWRYANTPGARFESRIDHYNHFDDQFELLTTTTKPLHQRHWNRQGNTHHTNHHSRRQHHRPPEPRFDLHHPLDPNDVLDDLCRDFDGLSPRPRGVHHRSHRPDHHCHSSRSRSRHRALRRHRGAARDDDSRDVDYMSDDPPRHCPHSNSEFLMSGGRDPRDRVHKREERDAELAQDDFGIWHECAARRGGRRSRSVRWWDKVDGGNGDDSIRRGREFGRDRGGFSGYDDGFDCF